MASKQYISPIRLFRFCAIDWSGTINPSRIKKQVLAEYGMSASGFLEVDGFSYNKTDVLEEIDRPDFADRLALHQQVWDSPLLLKVLEENAINLANLESIFQPFQGNPDFDAFVSPYLAGPFQVILRSFLQENDLADAGIWLSIEGFLQGEDREEGFRPLRLFVEEQERVFKNVSRDNYASFRDKLSPWLGDGWFLFLNNFPAELYDQKHDLVVDLINLTVKIQKVNLSDCQRISFELIQLTGISSDLVSTIYSNNRVFNPPPGSSRSTPSSGGTNYWWLIWVIIMFVRIVSQGGCN